MMSTNPKFRILILNNQAIGSIMQQVKSEQSKKSTVPASIQQLIKEYAEHFNRSGTMEKIIPRHIKSKQDVQSLTTTLYYMQADSKSFNTLQKSLSDPIWDLLDRGGKRWRPTLCMVIAQIFGHPYEQVLEVAAACQIIHNGTLIVDDIQDSSKVRRNKPCVHLLFGVDVSVNAGNFMYFAPLNYLLQSPKFDNFQKQQIGRIYAQQMTSLHIGQAWDILWHQHKSQTEIPNEHDYLQMTAHKTGVLARLSVRLTCLVLKTDSATTLKLVKFAQTMGVVFQIQDDILNIKGNQYIKTKGYAGQDIHQGKITLMVIHALHKSPKKQRLRQILKMKTEDQQLIRQAIQILDEADSIKYSQTVMEKLLHQAWSQLKDHLPSNSSFLPPEFLRQLAYFNISRSI